MQGSHSFHCFSTFGKSTDLVWRAVPVCLTYLLTISPQQVFPLTDLPASLLREACKCQLVSSRSQCFCQLFASRNWAFYCKFWESIPPFCLQNKVSWPGRVTWISFQNAFCVARYNPPKQIFENSLWSVFLENHIFDHCHQTRWLAFIY